MWCSILQTLRNALSLAILGEIKELEDEEEEEEIKEEERLRLDRMQKKRQVWTRKWLLRRDSERRGIINLAHHELRYEDPKAFEEFFRMPAYLFDRLLNLVGPHIQRQDTTMRKSVSPRDRLSVTLRFLATGESFRSLEFSTKISSSSIAEIIPETCRLIYRELKSNYLKVNT